MLALFEFSLVLEDNIYKVLFYYKVGPTIVYSNEMGYVYINGTSENPTSEIEKILHISVVITSSTLKIQHRTPVILG